MEAKSEIYPESPGICGNTQDLASWTEKRGHPLEEEMYFTKVRQQVTEKKINESNN